MFQCTVCEIDFGELQEMYVEHMSAEHLDTKLCCVVCAQEYNNGLDVAMHTINAHCNTPPPQV